MEFNSNIADILTFSSCFARKNTKNSSKMEFNSRLDEKPISCGKNQGQQSVTLQYLYFGVHL